MLGPLLALMPLAFVPAAAEAESPWPPVKEIAFAGNATTRVSTMLREIFIHVGQPADPERIEHSRQAIQDLGLFRSVEVAQQPVAGGVRLLFTVKEKYYVIPAPRVDTNSDGQYSYGVQLRWYNAFGLNHTARATLKYANRQQEGRGTALHFDAGYTAPFIGGTPYGLNLSVARSIEPVKEPVPYDEIRSDARVLVSRRVAGGYSASQGLRISTGLHWQRQTARGDGAPPSDGKATAWVLGAGYTDVRNNLYSEAGTSAALEVENTLDNSSSDYDITLVTGGFDWSGYVGDTPHQSVGVFAQAGAHHGGPREGAAPFQLGGSGDLRGYRHNFIDGDTYYYAGVEVLRPLHWDWLRGVAFIEAGDTFDGDGNVSLEHSYADVGVGLRLRATWFVRFEVNVGVALPLVDAGDGTGMRVFGTGRR